MRIALGCDEVGFPAARGGPEQLSAREVEVIDFGVHSTDPVLYPNVALEVAQAVAAGACDRGILICGTGIGMSITANKVPTVRAALCHDTYSAERARKSNDAQVLTMGARVIGSELAKQIVTPGCESEFEGGGSLPKVVRMKEIDEEYRGQA
jgi:ribose 5-phosphate isomerase B